MDKLIGGKIFWLLLLLTIAGEFFLPWLLKFHYPGYCSRTMVMSVLGSPASPVRKIYNLWLIWLGCFLVLTAIVFFWRARALSVPLAVMILLSILIFAIGAGVLSGLFSVNETKEMATTASRIHGAGAAIGFMTLLFFPLLSSIAAFLQKDLISAALYAFSFILALAFFTCFIMADKESFQNTVISYEGLWQRLSLLAMYVPFLHQAAVRLLAK